MPVSGEWHVRAWLPMFLGLGNAVVCEKRDRLLALGYIRCSDRGTVPVQGKQELK